MRILPPKKDAWSQFPESPGNPEGNRAFDALLHSFIGRHAGTEPKSIEIGCIKDTSRLPFAGVYCQRDDRVYRTVGGFRQILNYAKGSDKTKDLSKKDKGLVC